MYEQIPALIHDHLAAMGIETYFAQIITSVEVGIRKPHPAIFARALTDLQIAPHQALYVGDTYTDDYQGATAANIRCVLIDPQQRYPQVPDRIATLLDLVPYVAHLQPVQRNDLTRCSKNPISPTQKLSLVCKLPMA